MVHILNDPESFLELWQFVLTLVPEEHASADDFVIDGLALELGADEVISYFSLVGL